MNRSLALSLLALVMVACQGPAPAPEVDASRTTEKSQAREGAFALEFAIDTLGTALGRTQADAEKAKGVRKEALDEIAGYLDSAGATLADLPKDAAKNVVVDSANDARGDLQAAMGIAGSLEPPDASLADELEQSLSALDAAIVASGGKPVDLNTEGP